MAAKKKTNIYDFVDDETIFSYNRFAEDVLNYLYSMFGVQKRDIPPARYATNCYKNTSHVLFVVSRPIKFEQIFFRPYIFNAFMESNAINRIGQDVTNLSKYLSEMFKALNDIFPRNMALYDSINKFVTSFALLVELTLFCIMKEKKKIIKKMALTWVTFFEKNLKKEFEAAGGISMVLVRSQQLWYLDGTLRKFIPDQCVPYKGQELLDLFIEELKKTIKKVFDQISVLQNRMSVLHLVTDSVEKTIEKEADPLRSVPTHERLGVPLHEEVLKRSFDPKILAPHAEAASTDSSDAAARLKFLSELSLERKKTIKLRLSKALGFQHKPSVAEVKASSSAGTKEPETKTSGRLSASHEPTRPDLVDLPPQVLEPPEASREHVANLQTVPESTTDNSSILGARPKTGMSSKKRKM